MSYNNDDNKIRRKRVSSSTSKTTNKTDNKVFNNRSVSEKIKNENTINRRTRSSTYSSRSRAKKSKRKKNKKLLKLFKNLLIAMLLVLALVSIVSSIYVFTVVKGSPKVTKELLEQNYISSEVVDNNDIPKYLKDAIVSIEDERFYKHNGVDTISLVRSVVHNLLTDTTQGGSTIEMQISKNLLTSDDKTIKRKLKDMFNATSMDKNISKDEILGIYLNNIYLGKSAYGVGKGAKVYFGKDVKDLNLAECAMLAGITNSPAKFGQFVQAKKRQETILYKMHELGYINDAEYEDALTKEVTFVSEIGK
ncbi:MULTISPECIES: biosynthetic peptidoglycan transglycosylase [unclassified Romboutsia]|uniref:biosynthetic peptidoglycan transglycosylase n=1 Tax=unclassified Romboutsia TaxID=2626894 RepID=UPI00189B9790|nr:MULTISPECIES: biosynthetic peptidoglycan transglycosylase [unclassified Romboutsia]MDB8803948.1 transglycosylase domain-containing protein [Romboutsia sp. 1001216sp1]MDB8806702.1 transglycosylase domain-containing protein [Romboutsia sp. 1001216sp1]MDB8809595.1 transglycosylase domain-containing protein [Romboutsia sp. 1001216sp1]MDB8815344.1 transglycosylase domain-containing protein [Romboutsia sp. 1001216sp1]MDB8818037.1 transglycosylase domain-containing protein [Romboutsia sp. 1001216s